MRIPVKNILPFAVMIMLASCNIKKSADAVFYNGVVYTVDNNFNQAQAFAVINGRIARVGSNEQILSKYESSEVYDLEGKPVYPGFNDSHCHFYGYATDLLKCDLYGTKSFDEVLERVNAYAAENKFSWILGRGWDQNDWPDKKYPDKSTLDSLYPDIPVFLMRIDGHAALCNSKALGMAGIVAGTQITGGEIVLKNGIPTGILIDNAVDMVKSKIPPFTNELIEEAILKAQQNCFAAGLTSLTDAGLGIDSIRFLNKMNESEKLKIRLNVMMSDQKETVDYFMKEGPYHSDRLNVRSIKVYMDGALGSRGACLKQEYADKPGHYGYMLRTPEFLDDLANDAMKNGFQLCVHAIGDSAVKTTLDVYNEHIKNLNNKRWRIEHCQVVDPVDLPRFLTMNLIPSVQPTHATSDMYWAEDRLGSDRVAHAYAYDDLKDEAGDFIIFGTDFPVEDISPILTYYAAVGRRDLEGFPPGGFLNKNKINRKDALRAMTIWGAYASFEENEKGTIEQNKVADFVVLSSDIMQDNIEDIPSAKVVATYLNGERVFGNLKRNTQ